MEICPTCGQENPDGFRLCGMCGASLVAGPELAGEERKIVSVLFTDLVGFTGRAEGLDPEDVRAMLSPYYARSGNRSSSAAARSRSSSATL